MVDNETIAVRYRAAAGNGRPFVLRIKTSLCGGNIMFAVRNFQGGLRVLAVCLSLTALAGPLSAQTTTIRVGVPSVPGEPQVYESVSTNQIDLALANTLPGTYPPNYTSDKAEDAFQSLSDLRQDLIVDVRNAALADPDIRNVFNISVGFNPINLKFLLA